MSNYLTTHCKGKWRILADVALDTNDFPIDCNGARDEDSVYITCRNDAKIYYYGLNESRRATFAAYIPSIGRGHNVKKAMKKDKIDFFNYDESDEEVVFCFNATDIEYIADMLGAKTFGANINPFSSKNLPKANIKVPDDEMQEYKGAIEGLGTAGMSLIKGANAKFMDEVLAKRLRPPKTRKPFDYKSDMKKLKLARDMKTYIWAKGLWSDYIDFLKEELSK